MIRVTVWNEYRHEKTDPKVAALYPRGIHAAIADALAAQPGFSVKTATLDEPEHGLTAWALAETDVLLWWGHMAHEQVSDDIVNRVYDRVMDGMGLIVLHSGHASKIFRKLMGTNTHKLRWREDGEMVRLWVMDYAHPIAEGLGDYFELPIEETYGEHFDIPRPDDLVFVSWVPGGEVFRSGCCWHRGQGRVFYFQPGHETCPTYYDANVQRVIAQAVRWAYREKVAPYVSDLTRPLPITRLGGE
ncbi:MAG: trehalose utilization protein ThuA [Clostridiales bacterium]|nr:trehalose utilization protein ThuA [Clostridiales bacterium]